MHFVRTLRGPSPAFDPRKALVTEQFLCEGGKGLAHSPERPERFGGKDLYGRHPHRPRTSLKFRLSNDGMHVFP